MCSTSSAQFYHSPFSSCSHFPFPCLPMLHFLSSLCPGLLTLLILFLPPPFPPSSSYYILSLLLFPPAFLSFFLNYSLTFSRLPPWTSLSSCYSPFLIFLQSVTRWDLLFPVLRTHYSENYKMGSPVPGASNTLVKVTRWDFLFPVLRTHQSVTRWDPLFPVLLKHFNASRDQCVRGSHQYQSFATKFCHAVGKLSRT